MIVCYLLKKTRLHGATKLHPLGCVWIPDLVREKEMQMEKLDDPTVRTIGTSTFFVFISFFLTKSLIQTRGGGQSENR